MARFERARTNEGKIVETELIPEGMQRLHITDVEDTADDKRKAAFARKVKVTLADDAGRTTTKTFAIEKFDQLTKQKIENKKVIGFLSSFIDGVMGADDFEDTRDLIGRYLETEIKHSSYTNRQGEEVKVADFLPWKVTGAQPPVAERRQATQNEPMDAFADIDDDDWLSI